MKKLAGLLILLGLLAGCGAVPEPTDVPSTQTPWIIVVTATPGPDSLAEVQTTAPGEVPPTQTPWIIIATPTRAARTTPTPRPETAEVTPAAAESEPSATPAPPTPTAKPAPGSLRYPAPKLLDPPSGITVAWKGTIKLVWEGVGPLAEDEYYHVHLERPPVHDVTPWWGDYVYTKDSSHFFGRSFLAPFHLAAEHGQADVYWWVRVVRKTGEDENGKPLGVDIGYPSERWSFVIEPRTDN